MLIVLLHFKIKYFLVFVLVAFQTANPYLLKPEDKQKTYSFLNMNDKATLVLSLNVYCISSIYLLQSQYSEINRLSSTLMKVYPLPRNDMLC